MTRSTQGMIGYGRAARVDPAFDRFLQAPVDEDRREIQLSVLSALARLDLDPWQEAAELGALAPAAAIERLTLLIAKVPEPASASRDAAGIASRLVALLPRSRPAPPSSDADEPVTADEAREQARGQTGKWLKNAAIGLLLLILAITLFTGSPLDAFLGSSPQEPTRVTAPASSLGVKKQSPDDRSRTEPASRE